jgi:hypothetical protein
MEMKKIFEHPAAAAFVQQCLEVQDAPQATILSVIPSVWEKLFA